MTGLSSAMIAYYDFDTDQPHRDTLQIFYGDIKDGWRGRTFFLMTMISTLHNLSRSLGYVRNFVGTFFGTKTAPQYTVELFRTSTTDQAKFRVCFKNTRRYINGIEEEVKENEKRKIYGNIALLIKSPRGSAFSSSSSFVPTIQQITPFLPRPAANGIIRS